MDVLDVMGGREHGTATQSPLLRKARVAPEVQREFSSSVYTAKDHRNHHLQPTTATTLQEDAWPWRGDDDVFGDCCGGADFFGDTFSPTHAFGCGEPYSPSSAEGEALKQAWVSPSDNSSDELFYHMDYNYPQHPPRRHLHASSPAQYQPHASHTHAVVFPSQSTAGCHASMLQGHRRVCGPPVVPQYRCASRFGNGSDDGEEEILRSYESNFVGEKSGETVFLDSLHSSSSSLQIFDGTAISPSPPTTPSPKRARGNLATSPKHKKQKKGAISAAAKKRQRGQYPAAKRQLFPKGAAEVLRAWMSEHILRPYPTEEQKKRLAASAGLKIPQLQTWFINARMRVWKPLIEAFYRSKLDAIEAVAAGDEEAATATLSDASGDTCSFGHGSNGPSNETIDMIKRLQRLPDVAEEVRERFTAITKSSE